MRWPTTDGFECIGWGRSAIYAEGTLLATSLYWTVATVDCGDVSHGFQGLDLQSTRLARQSFASPRWPILSECRRRRARDLCRASPHRAGSQRLANLAPERCQFPQKSVPTTGIPEPKTTLIPIPISPTRKNNAGKVLVRESDASM